VSEGINEPPTIATFSLPA